MYTHVINKIAVQPKHVSILGSYKVSDTTHIYFTPNQKAIVLAICCHVNDQDIKFYSF